MANTSKSPSEEKKEKNQNISTEIANDSPAVGATITPRDAALALASVASSNKSEKIADGRVLNALKTGDICSGFHCSTDPVLWVPIPKEYWIKVSSDEFRKIRISSGEENRTGAYKVKLKEFIKEYMSARVEFAKSKEEISHERMIEMFSEAVPHLNSTFEVVIPLNTWTIYLESQKTIKSVGTSGSAADETPDLGREPYAGWKMLNANLAAYMVVNSIKSEETLPMKTIAADVYARVEKDPERPRLPKLSSFEKEVSHVFQLMKLWRLK